METEKARSPKVSIAVIIIVGIIVVSVVAYGWYIQSLQPITLPPKQVFIFVQNGQWIAVKPNLVELGQGGIYMYGLNFTSTNFTEVEQWAFNQTK